MSKIFTILSLLLIAVLMNACASSGEGRSFGTVIDDEAIEASAATKLYANDEIETNDRIKVISVNGQVLLIGEIETAAKKILATEIVRDVGGVKKVVNELAVGPAAGIGTRSHDSWLTGKVKTALLGVDVPGFDVSRVNVSTARDIIYLMGLVTSEEGDAAAEQARTVSGVAKVVKVFEYTDG